jgi:GAF domain-containing protein
MVLRTGEAATGGEANEALAVPIKIDDQTGAVLEAHLPEGEGTWTPERVELLDALSAQIGQALDRARLYEATQRRAAREGAIRGIADEMQRATDMKSLLRITVEALNRTLHSSRVYVRIVEPESSVEDEV